jgi:hypothetical protein
MHGETLAGNPDEMTTGICKSSSGAAGGLPAGTHCESFSSSPQQAGGVETKEGNGGPQRGGGG